MPAEQLTTWPPDWVMLASLSEQMLSCPGCCAGGEVQSLCTSAQSASVLCTHLQALTATFSNLTAACKHVCLPKATQLSELPRAAAERCVLLAALSLADSLLHCLQRKVNGVQIPYHGVDACWTLLALDLAAVVAGSGPRAEHCELKALQCCGNLAVRSFFISDAAYGLQVGARGHALNRWHHLAAAVSGQCWAVSPSRQAMGESSLAAGSPMC